MPDVIITAEKRSELGSGPSGRFRREGRLPATVYGLGGEALSVTVPTRELEHVLHGAAGANTLITIKVDGDETLALARQIQRHPTRGELLHVDFVRIRRDVAVNAEVPVHIEGEAAGLREGGVLEQNLFTLTVSALPGSIPESIVADVTELNIGDQIRIQDLSAPEGVEFAHEPDELVVHVAVPRVVEEPTEGEVPEGEEGAEAAEPGAAEGAPAAEAGTDAGDSSE
jgi:large subunit ribosomal protein L25